VKLSDVVRAVRQHWRLVAGIFLLSCVAVGIFVLNRRNDTKPVRYQSAVNIRIAPRPEERENKETNRNPTTTIAAVSLSGQNTFALQAPIRAAALKTSKVAPTSAGFGASLSPAGDILKLAASAPTPTQARDLARAWADSYVSARRAAAAAQIKRDKAQLVARRNNLDTQKQRVDTILKHLMPIIYREILRDDAPFGRLPGDGQGGNPLGLFDHNILEMPAIPAGAPPAVLNLAYQRAALIDTIAQLSQRIAKLNIANETPEVFAQLLSQTPALRTTTQPATTLPATIALLAGLLLAITAAIALDRFDGRIRTPQEAALAFTAPVLSIIPADHDDFAVLDNPASPTAQAYRGLAAMSIATDRLPKAIMVSTPHGNAHEEVAANYAAALSRLGLKVALIATNPNQTWYTTNHTTPPTNPTNTTELLQAAQTHTLTDQHIEGRLHTTQTAPNLVLVPPAPEQTLELPLDGLPHLIQYLTEAGIDITVIAGPPLLEHADATLIAWATHTVLWAIHTGQTTTTDARNSATRLQLAGVTPFGIVILDTPTPQAI
jgi:Mrp family chromosome partitioning ATPase